MLLHCRSFVEGARAMALWTTLNMSIGNSNRPDKDTAALLGDLMTPVIKGFFTDMGFEAANIHLGTDNAGPMISRDLRKRRADWLHSASEKMLGKTSRDWDEWRQNGKSPKA